MYEVTVNDQKALSVDFKGDQVWIDGDASGMSISKVNERSFQVMHKGGSYTVHILELNRDDKSVVLRVNGKKARLAISTELDRLLKRMGLENAASSKVSDIKAPMPGLIHSVEVTPGVEVSKGDAVLILEAMKMENVIKSPTDGTIDKVLVAKGESVEKGQVMITFS